MSINVPYEAYGLRYLGYITSSCLSILYISEGIKCSARQNLILKAADRSEGQNERLRQGVCQTSQS